MRGGANPGLIVPGGPIMGAMPGLIMGGPPPPMKGGAAEFGSGSLGGALPV